MSYRIALFSILLVFLNACVIDPDSTVEIDSDNLVPNGNFEIPNTLEEFWLKEDHLSPFMLKSDNEKAFAGDWSMHLKTTIGSPSGAVYRSFDSIDLEQYGIYKISFVASVEGQRGAFADFILDVREGANWGNQLAVLFVEPTPTFVDNDYVLSKMEWQSFSTTFVARKNMCVDIYWYCFNENVWIDDLRLELIE